MWVTVASMAIEEGRPGHVNRERYIGWNHIKGSEREGG